MTKRPNPKHGFSILELIVVIVVFAILALGAVPTYREVISRTKITATQSSLAAIARAAMAETQIVNPNEPVNVDEALISGVIEETPYRLSAQAPGLRASGPSYFTASWAGGAASLNPWEVHLAAEPGLVGMSISAPSNGCAFVRFSSNTMTTWIQRYAVAGDCSGTVALAGEPPPGSTTTTTPAATTTTTTTTTPLGVVPLGRYRSEVFDDIVTHPAEEFATMPANLTIDAPGTAPYDFHLEFQRFEPAGDPMATNRKAVVILNGGGFRIGDDAGREQQRAAAEAWARAGWVAFTMEYPAYPNGFDHATEEEFPALGYAAMQDTARAALTFWDTLAVNADDWGIDMDATVLTGWSASGVAVIETLADNYRTAEGYTHFPKFRVALSGMWFWVGATLNTTNDSSLLMVHYQNDTSYDGEYAADWSGVCSGVTTSGVNCQRLEVVATGHSIWLQPSGSTSPETALVTECFGVAVAADQCSALTSVLPLADDATPQ